MSRKCRKTSDLQISVDLRAVIDQLQYLTIKSRPFIILQPFWIHIGKQIGKRTSDQTFQRQLLQTGQFRIPIAEDPVYGMLVLIKYHFYIRKCKGQSVETFIMLMIFFRCIRDLLLTFRNTLDHPFLFHTQFIYDPLLLAQSIFQKFPII